MAAGRTACFRFGVILFGLVDVSRALAGRFSGLSAPGSDKGRHDTLQETMAQ